MPSPRAGSSFSLRVSLLSPSSFRGAFPLCLRRADCCGASRGTLTPLGPPGSNHNFIADKLFSINESGRYKPENELDDASRKWQDNDLFQRARLVNCGWFLGVVVSRLVCSRVYSYAATEHGLSSTGQRLHPGHPQLQHDDVAVVPHADGRHCQLADRSRSARHGQLLFCRVQQCVAAPIRSICSAAG